MRRIAKPLALLALVLLAAPPLHARPQPSWESFLDRALALLTAPWTAKDDSSDGELRGGVDPNGEPTSDLRGGFDPDGLRSGLDPDGEPTSELRNGLDPNGSS